MIQRGLTWKMTIAGTAASRTATAIRRTMRKDRITRLETLSSQREVK